MKRRIGRFLAWIGGLVVVLVLLLVLVVYLSTGEKDVPERTVLQINFEQPVAEYVPDDPVAKLLAEDVLVLKDVVGALERAAQDDRVLGLVARVGDAPYGFAQIQEFRDAVLMFRRSGKPTVAYAETFGELGAGNGGYYLASAFETVYLQPSGDVGITGLALEHPFIKGALDSLGVTPRLDHRYEYKNAMNLFTQDGFTDAHREAENAVLTSLFEQMVADISTGRDLSPELLRGLIDRAPILGPEAVAAGLVDSLAYRDEVYATVRKQFGDGVDFLSVGNYLKRAGGPFDEGTQVALIYGVGSVVRGKSGNSPFSGDGAMGADTVTRAFRDAVKDDDIQAILFRIDSPGGSYVASDAIWRETLKAKNAGKPVIVSMGNVAASGGYFVAMHADKIIAQPGTLTGSIGVLGGKFVTTEFWEKLGVRWDTLTRGENAMIFRTGRDFSEAEWARLQAWLDRVYDDFTAKTADGRGMTKEDVHAVAKGRVWTGQDALARNLVDELGGFQVALGQIRGALGLADGAPIHLRVFPKEKTLLERILEKGLIRTLSNGDVLAQVVSELRPVFAFARAAGLTYQPGVLEIQPIEVH